MGFGDYYSTTVNVNGKEVYSCRYTPGYSMFPMNSCFGFGYGCGCGMGFGYGGFGMGCWGPGTFKSGVGAGLGFAAGSLLFALGMKLFQKNS